jgi:hypothetical protein
MSLEHATKGLSLEVGADVSDTAARSGARKVGWVPHTGTSWLVGFPGAMRVGQGDMAGDSPLKAKAHSKPAGDEDRDVVPSGQVWGRGVLEADQQVLWTTGWAVQRMEVRG